MSCELGDMCHEDNVTSRTLGRNPAASLASLDEAAEGGFDMSPGSKLVQVCAPGSRHV